MSFPRVLLFGVLACVLACPAFADEKHERSASDLFTEGDALLSQGDFHGAINAYITASKKDPSNGEYKQKAMMVKRVQSLKRYLDSQAISPQWEKIHASLHVFYLSNKVYGEALALDKMAHGKLSTATSASLLSETLLETGRDNEALKLLKGLNEKQMTSQNRIYLGIALARLKKMDEAREISNDCNITLDDEIGLLYDAARLNALLGEREKAYSFLGTCLEKLPPIQSAKVKESAKHCPDFGAISSDAGFARVMKIVSKVKQSPCSSGSDCGSCPGGSGCGSEKSR